MKTKKIICCLATLALSLFVASAATFGMANAADLTPSFDGVGVSLNENIVLKFSLKNFSEDYTLTFDYMGETYDGTVENGFASFNLVTPQYLYEVVTATIYNGETKVAEAQKSVKDYLYGLVRANKNDAAYANLSCEKFAKMKTLAVDMLSYGAAAQKKYAEQDGLTLVTADLTNEELALATNFVAPDNSFAAIVEGNQAGFEWVGAGIRFDYNVSLYFLVKPTDATAALRLKINDNEVVDGFSAENGVYKFRYENVNVVDFANAYTVKVIDADGNEIGQTLKYSVNTYALNMYSNLSMGELVKATYNYGVSALAYNNAENNHVYTALEFNENQRVIAGEDTLKNGLTVNKLCSVCSHSEVATVATYDTAKTFTTTDNAVEVTADGITYNVPVTVLTRIIAPTNDIILFGNSWGGWQIEFDRQLTSAEKVPDGYNQSKGVLGQSFVDRIEYSICNDSGVLGKISLIEKDGAIILSAADGKYNIRLLSELGNLYCATADFPNISIEWSKLTFVAIGDAYAPSTEFYVKAKVIAKQDTLYADSIENDFNKSKKFTTLSDDYENSSSNYLVTSDYAAPDANMMRFFNGWSADDSKCIEFNRYDSGKDNRLSNVNVAYIEYIIYDTYTGNDLGSIKLVADKERGGRLCPMDDTTSHYVPLSYNNNANAFSDFYIDVTKTVSDGGGISDNGQKLKDLIDYAIKDNIPSDGYYSIGFKGQVIVNERSNFEDSKVYDYGKMGVFSDLISNYRP